MSRFWSADGDGVVLRVRLTPNARREGIGDAVSDAAGESWLAVAVTAIPEKGKANDALVRLLGKRLRLPRTAFAITHGATSRQKRLRIDGDVTTICAALEGLTEPSG